MPTYNMKGFISIAIKNIILSTYFGLLGLSSTICCHELSALINDECGHSISRNDDFVSRGQCSDTIIRCASSLHVGLFSCNIKVHSVGRISVLSRSSSLGSDPDG